MKYNVGDKVRVRSDLIAGQIYGNDSFVDAMSSFCGKIATVESKSCSKYLLSVGSRTMSYSWTDEMLDHIYDFTIEL